MPAVITAVLVFTRHSPSARLRTLHMLTQVVFKHHSGTATINHQSFCVTDEAGQSLLLPVMLLESLQGGQQQRDQHKEATGLLLCAGQSPLEVTFRSH